MSKNEDRMPKPKPVVVCAVISKNRILLLKKTDESINGLAMPGGNIKPYENMSQAAVRKTMEETGIKSEYTAGLGIVSEHIKQGELLIDHVLLHLVQLKALTTKITYEEASWYSLDSISKIKHKIVPSNYQMIRKMILQQLGKYFDCVIDKKENDYVLSEFEKLS